MRGNSSDGSNGKMTGWFWKRGVGCLRCLGLTGEFFVLFVLLILGRVEKKNRWDYRLIEVFGNVCPKAKNGVLTPIIYIFYSKNSCKTAI